jgi:hypothetical protein
MSLPAVSNVRTIRSATHLDPVLRTEPRGVMEKHLEHLRLSGYSPATIYYRRRILLRLKAVLPVPLCEATPELLGQWRAGLAVTDDAVVTYVSHDGQLSRSATHCASFSCN